MIEISLGERMKADWDKRVSHDYRYWMSDGVSSDEVMWETGRRDLKILLDGLEIVDSKNTTLLEIGCGVGRIVNAAAEAGIEAMGIDVSERAIETAQKLNRLPNTTFLVGNGTDLRPLKDNSIDIGISFAAFGSTPSRVTAQYLLELSRVIKDDGHLRMQVYLGSEQDVPEEDTLALRSYQSDRFLKAMEVAGFEPDYIKELRLPFEVSDYDRGIVAYIVGARKIRRTEMDVDGVIAVMKDEPERSAGQLWKGSLDAHYVALARVRQQLLVDNIEAAKSSYEIALREYGEPTEEGEAVRKEIEEWENRKNIDLIKGSPKLEAGTGELNTISTQEGEVYFYKGICLSHQKSPKKAGLAWAKRALNDSQDKFDKIVLVGIGDCNFALALRELYDGEIIIYETDQILLQKFSAPVSNKFTIVSSLSKFSDLISVSCKCISLPAAPFYNKSLVDEVRVLVSSRKYSEVVNPRIGIVGPFAGGTLPIAGYLQRALKTLDKECHYVDLSQFNPMFLAFSKMLQKRTKQSDLENSFIELVSDLILNVVEEKNLDIVISVAQAPLSSSALDKLRAKGVITAHWFMEDTRRFTSWKQIAKCYDYFFLIQKGESEREIIEAGGTRVKYLPLACDPEIHAPRRLSQKEREEYGSKVSFVGAGYNNRLHVFSKLSDLDFKIWGSEWPNVMPFDRMVQRKGERVSVEDYIKVFSASAINLNLHSSQERDGVDPSGDFVNPRVFELAACGAFQLSDSRSLLPELFEVGKEVITFSSESEIRNLILHYLENPAERLKVIEAARVKVLAEHTYAHRIKSMLAQITSDFARHLISRSNSSPWQKTLKAAEPFPELKNLLEKAKEDRLEPTLDSIVQPIIEGNGVLNEVEQKLLFMHHMKGQINQVNKLRSQ